LCGYRLDPALHSVKEIEEEAIFSPLRPSADVREERDRKRDLFQAGVNSHRFRQNAFEEYCFPML